MAPCDVPSATKTLSSEALTSERAERFVHKLGCLQVGICGVPLVVFRQCPSTKEGLRVTRGQHVKNWTNNLINDVEGIRQVLLATKRVAVLGIRSEQDCSRPAFYVPQYLISAGLQVIPVAVHDLKVHEILGQRVFRRLTDIPGELDLVDVFRRSEDIPAHLDDLLAKRPTAVWLQSGIRNDEAAESLAQAGIKVVQDRCLMVEYRKYVNHEKA